ncbi:MAG: radical SAM protein [Deltaproteobacteria bacterium]|nr:radical SAM protein [Deltaproteobacteria bacterium]
MSLLELQRVPGSGLLIRPEPFGGTLALRRPEMMILVDRTWMRNRGLQPGQLRADVGPLDPSAPFEAHLTLGHRCDQGCQGCYIGADEDGPELGLAAWREILEALAHRGVYHLALGGGELLDWGLLLELARYARQLGMTPNLSTAGSRLTPKLARKLEVFERVHLSMDGVREDFVAVRGFDGFDQALMSLRILRAYHKRVGVNCVVARANADGLPSLFALLDREGIRNVELLRFKPVGRGADCFDALRPSRAQLAAVVPAVLRATWRHRLRVRLDCSFTPMVCAAGVRPDRLLRLGLAGCVGGSWLVSIDGRGRLAACSFDEGTGVGHEALADENWALDFTRWHLRAPEPCRSCPYLMICRGGCHVVARHDTGDFQAPDPDCPFIEKSNRSRIG